MTKEQLTIIGDLFEKACSKDPDLGSRFYARLSGDYPELMNFFASVGLNAQHTRFISMIRIILGRMSGDLPYIPLLEELGKAHQSYRIGEDEFEKFGITLMKVLQTTLGTKFDKPVRDAWCAVYNEIIGVMISAIDHSPSQV